MIRNRSKLLDHIAQFEDKELSLCDYVDLLLSFKKLCLEEKKQAERSSFEQHQALSAKQFQSMCHQSPGMHQEDPNNHSKAEVKLLNRLNSELTQLHRESRCRLDAMEAEAKAVRKQLKDCSSEVKLELKIGVDRIRKKLQEQITELKQSCAFTNETNIYLKNTIEKQSLQLTVIENNHKNALKQLQVSKEQYTVAEGKVATLTSDVEYIRGTYEQEVVSLKSDLKAAEVREKQLLTRISRLKQVNVHQDKSKTKSKAMSAFVKEILQKQISELRPFLDGTKKRNIKLKQNIRRQRLQLTKVQKNYQEALKQRKMANNNYNVAKGKIRSLAAELEEIRSKYEQEVGSRENAADEPKRASRVEKLNTREVDAEANLESMVTNISDELRKEIVELRSSLDEITKNKTKLDDIGKKLSLQFTKAQNDHAEALRELDEAYNQDIIDKEKVKTLIEKINKIQETCEQNATSQERITETQNLVNIARRVEGDRLEKLLRLASGESGIDELIELNESVKTAVREQIAELEKSIDGTDQDQTRPDHKTNQEHQAQ